MMRPVAPLFLLVVLFGCSSPEASDELHDEQFDYVNWEVAGGDVGISHYSKLDQINKENVAQLEVAWTYRSGDTYTTDLWWWPGSSIQANPIVVDGVLYTTTPTLHLVALDAASGEEIWRYDPFGGKEGGGYNRGVAYWEDGDDKRLFYAVQSDLHAVDVETGRPVSAFGEQGRAFIGDRAASEEEEDRGVTAPAAAVVFEDIVVLGGMRTHGGGNVWAFDARTGERVWVFHTIPHPGEKGYETWGDSTFYRAGGGANVWAGLSVDVKNEMVFFATGQAKDDFYRPHNEGIHLFSNSVVAVDARSGAYKWHWQELHHEIWDLDVASPPLLATVERYGEKIPGLVQLSKTGNTYIFNRLTGELLSDVEEKPAPPTTLYGAWSHPTQPVTTNPEPFSKQFVVSKDDLTNISEASYQYALERWKNADTGWYVPPSERGIIYYGIHGGAEWPGGAYDPENGHLYINANEIAWFIQMQNIHGDDRSERSHPGQIAYQLNTCISCHGVDRQGVGGVPALADLDEKYELEEVLQIMRNGRNAMPPAPSLPAEDAENIARFLLGLPGIGEEEAAGDEEGEKEPFYVAHRFERFLDPEGYPATKPPWGTMNAIDLNTGTISWSIPLGEYPELTERGIPPTGTENFGGPVVTRGGLVFIGASADEKFHAFDKDTGELLWEYKLPYGGYATPSTYMVGGRQYVVIPCGGGGKPGTPSGDTWVAFALPE